MQCDMNAAKSRSMEVEIAFKRKCVYSMCENKI